MEIEFPSKDWVLAQIATAVVGNKTKVLATAGQTQITVGWTLTNGVMVFINGVITDAYTQSGSVITFTNALAANDEIIVID